MANAKSLPKFFLGILVSFLLYSCATSKITTDVKMELRNWRAESENVVNLSVLLEDDGTEGNPILLNPNTLIFESKKNDNYDIWSIDPNKKGGIVQLTTYDGPDRVPCPHPDGKRYVFLSDRSETGYYIGEVGKSTVTSLVEAREPNVGLVTRASVSPDGKTLLYVSGKYIWTFDFETKTKTQFIQGTEPRWSPDGKKIIFRKVAREISKSGSTAGTVIVSTSIWIMNVDGTEQTELISGDNNFTYSGAEISPDGKRILYLKRKVVVRAETVDFYYPDIWVCKIDGTEHTQITTNPLSDQEAAWIDNQTIVFASDRPQSGNYDDKKWDLWKAKLNL